MARHTRRATFRRVRTFLESATMHMASVHRALARQIHHVGCMAAVADATEIIRARRSVVWAEPTLGRPCASVAERL